MLSLIWKNYWTIRVVIISLVLSRTYSLYLKQRANLLGIIKQLILIDKKLIT